MFGGYPTNGQIRLLVIYSLVVLVVVVAVVTRVYATVFGTTATTDSARWESSLLLLVACSGAMGGLIHLVTSLGHYVGERTLDRSWLLFYYFRPVAGIGLALIVYFVLRMSFAGAVSPQNLNAFTVLSFAALAGLFSRQAIDKLADVFDTLFQKARERIASTPLAELATAHKPDLEDFSEALPDDLPPPRGYFRAVEVIGEPDPSEHES